MSKMDIHSENHIYRKYTQELQNNIGAQNRENLIYRAGVIDGLKLVINYDNTVEVENPSAYFGNTKLSKMITILAEALEIDAANLLKANESNPTTKGDE